MTGSSVSRPAWNALMTRVRPTDTVVVAWLGQFGRNVDEGMRIQAELTKQNIGIVAISEAINADDDSAAAQRLQGNGRGMARQLEPGGEMIEAGLDRARAGAVRGPERPPGGGHRERAPGCS